MWTIWNEPNGAYFWSPRFIDGDMVVARRYARLYDAAARRIKAVDPALLVAAGPTAPMPPDLKPITFLQAVRRTQLAHHDASPMWITEFGFVDPGRRSDRGFKGALERELDRMRAFLASRDRSSSGALR